MKAHCDRGEYISIAEDQWPRDKNDRDVGSEGEQDDAERGNINGTVPLRPLDQHNSNVGSERSWSDGEQDEAWTDNVNGDIPNEIQE